MADYFFVQIILFEIVLVLFTGIITSYVTLKLEYHSGRFIKSSNEPEQDYRENPSLYIKVLRNYRFILYFVLIILVVLVVISNFVFFRVISPININVGVATISCFFILILFGNRFLNGTRILQKLPLKFPALPQRLLFLSSALLLVTAYSAYGGPDYVIMVLPITDGTQIRSDIIQRVEQYLDFADYGHITVREFDCLGTCLNPDSYFLDSRVLLVISGELEPNESGKSTFQLRIAANCRRDPSPIDRKFTVSSDCTFSNSFPYENWADSSLLDVYLPILLLNSMAQAGNTKDLQIGLVNQAIRALDSDILLSNSELAWLLHEKLFYDILYNLPNLSLKERIDSAGEVRARATKLLNIDNRLTLMTAKWYEESGVINSNNYENAIVKYQEVLLEQQNNAYVLSRLSSISEQLYRYSDAICYLSEALNIRQNNQDRLRLASLHEKLGVPFVPNDSGEVEQTPQEIRTTIQEETIAEKDATSIQEYFTLAELSLDANKYEDALQYVDRILQSSNLTSAEKAGAYYLEGRIRHAQSDFDNAIKAYSRFIEISRWEQFGDENLVSGYSALGVTYHARGFHDKSSESYKETLGFVIRPEKRAALLAQLAEQYKLDGHIDTSLAYFEESNNEYQNLDLGTYPLSVQIDYIQMLHNYAFLVKDQTEQDHYFEHVLDFYSGLIEDINQKASKDFEGCDWIVKNLYEEPEQSYEYLQGYISEPYIPVFYYLNRRSANYQLGNTDDVRQDAQRAIEYYERSAHGAIDYFNLGLAYATIGDEIAAITAFQKAIDLDNPDVANDLADATDYHQQGLAYTRLYSYTLAIQALTIASELQATGDPILAAQYYRDLAHTVRSWVTKTGDSENLQIAIDADYRAIGLDVSNDIKAKSWFSIGLTYLQWAKYDPAHYSDTVDALKRAIQLDHPGETALGTDLSDAEDWAHLGDAYRNWGIETGDLMLFSQAVDAYLTAANLHQSDNWKAGQWFDIGSTYLALSKFDESYFPDAIQAWMEAIQLDNPEQTLNGIDTRDIADWYMIAVTYRNWSNIDNTKLSQAIESLDKALAIPIDPDDSDYIWHELAQDLSEELQINR